MIVLLVLALAAAALLSGNIAWLIWRAEGTPYKWNWRLFNPIPTVYLDWLDKAQPDWWRL